MSDTMIVDPSTARRAGVTPEGRLRAASVASTPAQWAAAWGDSFDVSSGIVTLTSPGEWPLLLLRNDADRPLRPSRFAWSLGANHGAPDQDVAVALWDVTKGSAASMVSPATVGNRRIGDVSPAPIFARVGGSGIGFSGATLITRHLLQPARTEAIPSEVVMPPHTSILLTVWPFSMSPTAPSMRVHLYLVCELISQESM